MNKDFPKKISVFPLRGAIFFPKTNLPLNIFEKRYVSMVEDALKGDKYIGMVPVSYTHLTLPTKRIV